jgi:hypothetical protein
MAAFVQSRSGFSALTQSSASRRRVAAPHCFSARREPWLFQRTAESRMPRNFIRYDILAEAEIRFPLPHLVGKLFEDPI